MKHLLDTKFLDNITLAKAIKLQEADRATAAIERAIKGLPAKVYSTAPITRVDITCTQFPALSIRIGNRADRKVWTLTYNAPGTGEQKRETLGCYGKEENGAVSVKIAHDRAFAIRESVHNEVDPAEAKVAKAAMPTFGEVMEERLAAEVFGMQKDAKATAHRFRTVFAAYLTMPFDQFKVNPHFNDLIKGHVAKKQLRSIKRVRSDLNCIFDFAVGQQYVPVNPIPKKKKAKRGGGVVMTRAHALSPDRFTALWHKLPEVMTRKKEIAVKLAMVTGQRIGEIVGMDVSEIVERSPTDWVWVLPGNVRNANMVLIEIGRTKNGHRHAVPLSPLAQKLVKELRAMADGPKLFATKGKPLTTNNVASSIWTAQQQGKFGIGDFTVHMTRHTMITGMKALGVDAGVRSLVVNHVMPVTKDEGTSGWAPSQTTKTYTHDGVALCPRELKAKRDALDLWGNHVAELVGEAVSPAQLKVA